MPGMSNLVETTLGDTVSERKRAPDYSIHSRLANSGGWVHPSIPQGAQQSLRESSAIALQRTDNSHWSDGTCPPLASMCFPAAGSNDTPFVGQVGSGAIERVGVDERSSAMNTLEDSMNVDFEGFTASLALPLFSGVDFIPPSRDEIRHSSLQEIMDRIPSEIDELSRLKTA